MLITCELDPLYCSDLGRILSNYLKNAPSTGTGSGLKRLLAMTITSKMSVPATFQLNGNCQSNFAMVVVNGLQLVANEDYEIQGNQLVLKFPEFLIPGDRIEVYCTR